jgi:hypothetical protein
MTLFLSTAMADGIVVSISGEQHGGGLSVMWLNPKAVSIGASHYQFRESKWNYVTANHLHAFGRVTLEAEANLGRGRARESFNYSLLRLNAKQEVMPRRFYVELEDRYIDIDRQKGNLLRGGVMVAANRLSITASGYRSISGNLGARYVSGRADWSIGRRTLLAGAAFGRSQPLLFQPLDVDLPPSKVRELFGGVALPARAGTMTLVLSALHAAGSNRVRATVSWTHPN